jgi:hypothetical protein
MMGWRRYSPAVEQKPPPRAVVWWEALEGGKQAALALPVLSVILFFAHLGPLHQPVGRAIGYGIFWAIPATWAVVTASQHERRKRQKRDGHDPV